MIEKKFCLGVRGAAFLVLVCLVAGCNSSKSGSVAGTISFNGTPIEKGTVSFSRSSVGRTAQAEIGEGGAYTLHVSGEALPPGEYMVAISPLISYENVKTRNGLEPKMVMEGQESIPLPYRASSTTRLRAEITGGDDVFDFDMTKKTKK